MTFMLYKEIHVQTLYGQQNSFQASTYPTLNRTDFKIMKAINPAKCVQTFDWQFKSKSIK